MMKHKILYAEDDATLAFLTKDNLEQQGFKVDHFADGQSCFDAFSNRQYDICILDVMMPGLNGFSLAAAIRKVNYEIPILFLSAKTMKEDRLKGLRLGADDYLIKPFSIEELVLKIEIFIARSKKTDNTPRKAYEPGKKACEAGKKTYEAGRFIFDPGNFSLQAGDTQTMLTQREAALLQYFLDHRNRVLKREQILTSIWGQDDYFFGRSLDVFVSRLRKIFAGDDNISIENRHGIGFKLIDRNDAT